MNVLLAGCMGVHAERLLALRDAGCTLVYCTLPPRERRLPDDFGDDPIPRFVLGHDDTAERLKRILGDFDIDVVYSMKNAWDGSLELVNVLLDAGLGPVVRHYKEHFVRPSDAERRTLIETAGQIYVNEESFAYFRETYDVDPATAHVMDTDYLPAKYMTHELRPKLRECDGSPHIVIAGTVSTDGGRSDVRELCAVMARRGVHTHIYGRKFVGRHDDGVWRAGHRPTQEAYETLAHTGRVHLHAPIAPARFTYEWSVYDAGVMHVTAARPDDDPFSRMNHPNRLGAYLAAGLPVVQQRSGHDAMSRMLAETGFGLVYDDLDELADLLQDGTSLAAAAQRARELRRTYTIEHHLPRLVAILRSHARI